MIFLEVFLIPDTEHYIESEAHQVGTFDLLNDALNYIEQAQIIIEHDAAPDRKGATILFGMGDSLIEKLREATEKVIK